MQRALYHKKPKHIGNFWINNYLANPAQDLCILCILKRIHLQPLLVGDMPTLFPSTKFAKIMGKTCSAFLARESEHSAVCLSMQSKTKSPRAEAGSQACTLSSLQADKHRQQCVNERAMYAVIMQRASAPSSSH